MSRPSGTSREATRRPRREPVPLLVPPEVSLKVSPEDFWRLCCKNSDLRLERTAQGKLIVMAPASSGSGHRNASLTTRIGVWAEADRSGLAFDSSAGFTLPNGAIRAPDVSWIRRERWEQLSEEQRELGFAPICPDFVVEIWSHTDRISILRKKMAEYIEQGARLGWLIHPKRRTVEIYRTGRPPELRERPETLSGGEVLPGLVLNLSGILID